MQCNHQRNYILNDGKGKYKRAKNKKKAGTLTSLKSASYARFVLEHPGSGWTIVTSI